MARYLFSRDWSLFTGTFEVGPQQYHTKKFSAKYLLLIRLLSSLISIEQGTERFQKQGNAYLATASRATRRRRHWGNLGSTAHLSLSSSPDADARPQLAQSDPLPFKGKLELPCQPAKADMWAGLAFENYSCLHNTRGGRPIARSVGEVCSPWEIILSQNIDSQWASEAPRFLRWMSCWRSIAQII